MATSTTEEQQRPALEGATSGGQTPADAPALPAPRTPAAQVPVRMGMAPQSIEEAWRLAQVFAKSGLVPKNFQGRPEDILVAIELGTEIGLAPMQALQSIAVINGRPSVWGDGFLALLMASPLYRDHDEYFMVDNVRRDVLTPDDLKKDTTTAVCTFWRHGKTMPVTRSFSVGQAKKAELLGKSGPWQQYPDRMLRMRARSWAGRDAFPDILRGIRTAEEAVDTTAADDPPFIEAQPSEPIQPRRASESATATPSPTPPLDKADTPAIRPTVAPGNAPSAPASGEAQLRGLLIVKTHFVRPSQRGVEPYFEVLARSSAGRDVKFITRDEALFKEAGSFEGTDHPVVIGYRDEPVTQGSDTVHVLTRLAIYEASDLFE